VSLCSFVSSLYSFVEHFNPKHPFFTHEENEKRSYLMDKYLANIYAIEDGNPSCLENIEEISQELDDIFRSALERYRGRNA